jgi:tetratricopeptide (TPR) repeat protein
VLGYLLAIALVAIFIWDSDFYKRQFNKARGFYHVHEGDRYFRRGLPQKAIESYNKALEFHPRHWKAQYNLANIYVVYEDYERASEAYEKALKIKPDLQMARIDHAIVLSEAMFNYDRAIDEYHKAIEIMPRLVYVPFIIDNKYTSKHNKGIAYYNLGLAWRGKSLLAGKDKMRVRQYLLNAIEAYENSLKINKNYNTYYNLAIAYHVLGDFANAGINYCNAIDREPMNYEAHFNLAILLKSMKNYKLAIDEFKKAGFILNIKGDGIRTGHVYDIVSNASKILVDEGEYQYLVENLDDITQVQDWQLDYIGGKVILTRELDRGLVKNFRNCRSRGFFEELRAKHQG